MDRSGDTEPASLFRQARSSPVTDLTRSPLQPSLQSLPYTSFERWINRSLFYKALPDSCLPHLTRSSFPKFCLCLLSISYCNWTLNPLPPISPLRAGTIFLNQENNSHLTPILQQTLGSQPLAPVARSTPMTINSEAWIPGPARDPAPSGLSPYSGSMLWWRRLCKTFPGIIWEEPLVSYIFQKKMEMYTPASLPHFTKEKGQATWKLTYQSQIQSPTVLPQRAVPHRGQGHSEHLKSLTNLRNMTSFCINPGSNLTIQMLPELAVDFQFQLLVDSLLAPGSWLWAWPLLFKTYVKNT